MALSRKWTKATPLSKFLALIFFISLPILSFYFGYYMGKASTGISLTDNTIIYKLVSPKSSLMKTCVSNLKEVKSGQTCCKGLTPKVTSSGARVCTVVKTT